MKFILENPNIQKFISRISAHGDRIIKSKIPDQLLHGEKVNSQIAIERALTDRATILIGQGEYDNKAREKISNSLSNDDLRLENKTNVLLLTAKKMKGEENIHAEGEVDDDWLNVFEQYAENASSERLREMWARVLSKESISPGNISLRTLRFLSEASKIDGDYFEEFAAKTFGGFAIRDVWMKCADQAFSKLMHLGDIGLISSPFYMTEKTFYPENGNHFYINHGNLELKIYTHNASPMTIGTVVMSYVGMDLYGMIKRIDLVKSATTTGNYFKQKGAASFEIYNTIPDGSKTLIVKG